MVVPQVGKGNMMQEKYCEMTQIEVRGIGYSGNIAQHFGSASNMPLFNAIL
jgi:hypothetical protein